jgi:hypothetical protein
MAHNARLVNDVASLLGMCRSEAETKRSAAIIKRCTTSPSGPTTVDPFFRSSSRSAAGGSCSEGPDWQLRAVCGALGRVSWDQAVERRDQGHPRGSGQAAIPRVPFVSGREGRREGKWKRVHSFMCFQRR